MAEDPIQIKILKHLYEIGAMDNDQIDITDFLITLWRKEDPSESRNDLSRIKTALHRLQKIELIFYSYSPDGSDISQEKTRPGTGEAYKTTLGHDRDIDEVSVKANITWKGYEYIAQEVRNRQQDKLNDNTITTNTSLQQANKSTLLLNAETKKYYGRASLSTWIIAILTFLSLCTASISAYTSKRALSENHKQFEIETTPFLQIGKVSATLQPGKIILIHYELSNLGKDQAKVISGIFDLRSSDAVDTLESENSPELMSNPLAVNFYAIKENPIAQTHYSRNVLDSANYALLMTNKLRLYLVGKIKYVNLVNQQFREYSFNIEIFESPYQSFKYLYNENRISTK